MIAVVVAGLATSLLTLYAIIKAWNKAFWQTAPSELPRVRTPRSMFGPAAALVVASCAITFLAGPMYRYADDAATDLRARSPYIDAVLVDGVRGDGESAEAVPTDDATTTAPEPGGEDE